MKTRLAMTAVSGLVLTSAVTNAEVYSLVSGASDLCDVGSYKVAGETPQSLPGGNDSLKLSAGASLEVSASDTAQWERLNSIKYILLDSASLTVDCAVDATLACGLSSNRGSSETLKAFVKKGTGTLTLGAIGNGKSPALDGSACYDVYVDLLVEQGDVLLSADAEKTVRTRDVTVAENASLQLCNRTSGSTSAMTLYFENLYGYGLVTNVSANAEPVVLSAHGQKGSFHGCINGNFDLRADGGTLDLWGENNRISGVKALWGGNVGIKRFDAGAGCSGSAGNADISTRGGGGTIRYLGEGGTCGFNITMWNCPEVANVFDAGAHGGLTVTGGFEASPWGNQPGMYNLCLTGSNRTECVLKGDIKAKTINGVPYAVYLTKDGSGTWYLKDTSDAAGRSFAGMVEVKNGTLKFDSVAERGCASSLGKADVLSSQKTGYPRDFDQDVDYAFVLGSDTTEGAMEFVGTENNLTTTRPAVLAGTGALVNNSTNSEFRLRGVSALTSGAKKLVLGGTNTMKNVVWDVTDGAGVVSVEKRGSGVWTLCGTNSFSGDLIVKEGTLVVCNEKNAPYSWFRLLIKQVGSTHPDVGYGTSQTNAAGQVVSGENLVVSLSEWGLYAEDGTRVNGNLDQYAELKHKPLTLPPMQSFIDSKLGFTPAGALADNSYRGSCELFDGNDYVSMQLNMHTDVPKLDDPDTWLSVVFRLADDSAPVRYFDVFYPAVSHKGRCPTAFDIQGSVDGYHRWDTLFSTNDVVEIKQTWLSGLKKTVGGNAVGFPIRLATNDFHTLSNVSTVRVESGAVLKAVGEVVLSDLTVDCSDAGGRIDGFTLSETGVLRILNMPNKPVELPLVMTGIGDLDRLAGWNVVANGRADAAKVSVRADGRVFLSPPAFMLIIR